VQDNFSHLCGVQVHTTEITEVIISMIATSLSGMTGSDDVDEVASGHLTSAGETMAGTYQ